MPGSPMSSSIKSTRLLSEFVQRLGSVARLVRAVSGVLKQRRDGVAKGTVVVDDQHMPAGSRGCHAEPPIL